VWGSISGPRLALALACGDLAGVRTAAHALRGIAGNLGLAALAGLGGAIEDAALAGAGGRLEALGRRLEPCVADSLARLVARRL